MDKLACSIFKRVSRPLLNHVPWSAKQEEMALLCQIQREPHDLTEGYLGAVSSLYHRGLLPTEDFYLVVTTTVGPRVLEDGNQEDFVILTLGIARFPFPIRRFQGDPSKGTEWCGNANFSMRSSPMEAGIIRCHTKGTAC